MLGNFQKFRATAPVWNLTFLSNNADKREIAGRGKNSQFYDSQRYRREIKGTRQHHLLIEKLPGEVLPC